jgi:hypothetical protein
MLAPKSLKGGCSPHHASMAPEILVFLLRSSTCLQVICAISLLNSPCGYVLKWGGTVGTSKSSKSLDIIRPSEYWNLWFWGASFLRNLHFCWSPKFPTPASPGARTPDRTPSRRAARSPWCRDGAVGRASLVMSWFTATSNYGDYSATPLIKPIGNMTWASYFCQLS